MWEGTRNKATSEVGLTRYVCQATQLPEFTEPLPWWNISQYIEDITSGNVTVFRAFRGLIYAGFYNLSQAGIGLGRPLRRIYDEIKAAYGGLPFPRYNGTIPVGQTTPTLILDLQPGEMVRVKSYLEILKTLDTDGRNHGLLFDAEMVPYCGGVYRIRGRVNNYIEEKTGVIRTLKNPAVILEGVSVSGPL